MTVSLKHLTCKPPEDISLIPEEDTSSNHKEGACPMPEPTMDTLDDSRQMPVQQESLCQSPRKRNTPAYIDDY
ncbi:hypothetical protein SK128_025385, partial [Halocaridina rubra]